MRLWSVISCVATAVEGAPDTLHVLETWGQASVTSPALIEPRTTDTLLFQRAASLQVGSPEVWLIERVTQTTSPQRNSEVRRWADSRSCSALVPTLQELNSLQPLRIEAPSPLARIADGDARQARAHATERAYDVDEYRIEAPGRWPSQQAGRISVTGAAGSPAAVWITSAMRALAPCWRNVAPDH